MMLCWYLATKYCPSNITNVQSNITHQILHIKYHPSKGYFITNCFHLFCFLFCSAGHIISIINDFWQKSPFFSRVHFLFLWDTRHHFVVLYLCNNHLRWKLISRGRCHSASVCQGYLLDRNSNRNWGEGVCYVILPCRRQTKLKPKMRRICPE